MGDGGEEVECRLNCEANPQDVLARFEKLVGIWPALRMAAMAASRKTNRQTPQDIAQPRAWHTDNNGQPASHVVQPSWTRKGRCGARIPPLGNS